MSVLQGPCDTRASSLCPRGPQSCKGRVAVMQPQEAFHEPAAESLFLQ